VYQYNSANYHNGYNHHDDYNDYNDYNNNYNDYNDYDRYNCIDNHPYGYRDFYCPDMYDYRYPFCPGLISNLEEYINDELSDSKYYEILAKKAPTQRSKELLMEFSKDEQMHAQNFMNAYFMLTGRMYHPPKVEDPKVPDDYIEALQQRILAETNDYKKYGEQYLKAPTAYLRDLFFMTRTSEAQHAMRIPYLIHEHHKQNM